MKQRGFSLIELLIVIGIIGLIASMAVPRVGRTLVRQKVRGARDAVVGMHAKARAAAVQRGTSTRLVLTANRLLIRTQHPVTGVVETVGEVEDLYSRYGVTLAASRDSLVFDPRGIGTEASPTKITVSRGAYSDGIEINTWGRLVK